MDVREAAKNYRRYTCEETDKWDTDVRFELIDGMIFLLATPLRIHQGISGELFKQLANFLTDKPCKVYSAPLSVYLDESDTRVEPDIVVVCDESKLIDEGVKGAPDLIIEILSPSTAKYDMTVKFKKYLQAEVREYWIVDPVYKTVSTYILKDGVYIAGAYSPDDDDVVSVCVLDGCTINIRDVFAD